MNNSTVITFASYAFLYSSVSKSHTSEIIEFKREIDIAFKTIISAGIGTVKTLYETAIFIGVKNVVDLFSRYTL